MEQIKSFEGSSGNTFGDILSRSRGRQRVKVGLLVCGYFEYWRMYPKTLKTSVEKDIQVLVDRLGQEFDIVYPGMVDTLDRAEEAGKVFHQKEVDALIVAEMTYLPDFISLHAINMAGNVPILCLVTQMDGNVDVTGDYEHSLRNSGLIAVAQLTGTFSKTNRKYKVVVGSLRDKRAYQRILSFVKALQAVKDIREANIGVVGHVFRGMYDLELDKTFLKGTFGVNIIYIQVSHLLEIWEKVDSKATNALADQLMHRFKMRTASRDDVSRACKLAIAMRKLLERFKLDALCFLEQHFVQKHTGTTARIGASLLIEKEGCMVTCEGDLGGLVMMMLMKSITGQSPLQGEWGEFDVDHNACLILGHGIGDPTLATSDEAVTLTRTPEEWGFEGEGLNYEYILRPGPVILGHIFGTQNGWQMLISGGQSIKFPTLRYDEIHAMIQVKEPVKEYLEKILNQGVAHHVVVSLSQTERELEDVVDLLGVEKFIA